MEHFVRHFSQRMNKNIDSVPSETMQVFLTYNWPGTIRELQNVIERAVILSSGPELKAQVQDLNIRVSAPQIGSHQTLQQAERTHILAILNQTYWVLSGPNGAATRLGMNRSTLQFRMRKLGIVRPSVDASPYLAGQLPAG